MAHISRVVRRRLADPIDHVHCLSSDVVTKGLHPLPCLRGPVALPGRYNRYYHKIDCTHTLVHCGGASRPQGTHHGHGHGLCPTFSVLGFSSTNVYATCTPMRVALIEPIYGKCMSLRLPCDECAVIASAPHGAICIPSPALCGVGSLAPFDG